MVKWLNWFNLLSWVKFFDFILLIAYCLVIYWLSGQPSLPAPMWFEHQDKLHHATAYGIMGFWAWRAFRHLLGTAIILALLSVVFCSLYGISDEWHQSFVPGREPGVADWLADTLGSALVVGLLCHQHYSKLQVASPKPIM